jgi:acyl carrier protein
MTMARAEIEQGIRDVAAIHLADVGSMAASDRLVQDLDLDSLELLTLSFEIENHFDIILEPDDETAIVTVADLADTIERLLHEADEAGNAA